MFSRWEGRGSLITLWFHSKSFPTPFHSQISHMYPAILLLPACLSNLWLGTEYLVQLAGTQMISAEHHEKSLNCSYLTVMICNSSKN